MLSKKKDTQQSCMFFGLEDMLNHKHPMYILAETMEQLKQVQQAEQPKPEEEEKKEEVKENEPKQ